jgi:hypothetical protein
MDFIYINIYINVNKYINYKGNTIRIYFMNLGNLCFNIEYEMLTTLLNCLNFIISFTLNLVSGEILI